MGDKAKKWNTFKECQTIITITYDLIFFHLGSRMPDPTKTKEERENFFVLPLFHKIDNLFIFKRH
jgi:hypothetical protein